MKKGLFDRRIPWNAGIDYDVNNSVRVGLYELYGSKLGFSLQITLDPKVRPTGSLMGPGPVPVLVRPSITSNPDAWSTSWTSQPDALAILRDNVAKQLAVDGLTLEALSVTADTAELRIINTTYDSGAQAIGRAARVLTQTMPASVETFRIVPVVDGIPISAVVISRTEIENPEWRRIAARLYALDGCRAASRGRHPGRQALSAPDLVAGALHAHQPVRP